MRLAPAVLACVACSSSSPAPPPGGPVARSARIAGTVTDPGGTPVSGARVEAAGRSAQSGGDGRFSIADVPEGTQLVVASASGRHTEVVALRVTPPETRVTLQLSPSTGDVELAFAGDVAFTSRETSLPDDLAPLYAATAPLLAAADLAVVNLESTMTAEPGAPHPTRPRLLLSPPAGARALFNLGVDIAAVANDHVYDYLDDGLLDTLDALRGAQLTPLGAGADARAAGTPVVVERNGVRVGLAAFSLLTGRADASPQYEPPFSDATDKKAGVARFDARVLDQTVTELRGRADRVVIVLHGGNDRDESPSPGVANAARRAIDAGADLVVANHPRAPGGLELYHDKLIAYSLGGFVFDDDLADGLRGMVLRVRLPKSGPPSRITVEPLILDALVPAAATGPVARDVIDRVAELSAPLGVTIVPDGERGRALLVDPATLPASEVTNSLDVPAMPGEGAVQALSDDLAPGQYVSRVDLSSPDGSALWLGRDVLGVGDFEDLAADGVFAGPSGWRLPSDAEQILAGDGAASGRTALSICRSASARTTATAESRGRVALPAGGSVSLCGCWRGDGGAQAAARVAFWESLDEDARPLDTRAVTDGEPPADWECFCHAAGAPEKARYASVRLDHTPSADHTACVYFDSLRLVVWTLQMSRQVVLPVPNRIGYVRVTGVGSAASAVVSVGKKTLEVPR